MIGHAPPVARVARASIEGFAAVTLRAGDLEAAFVPELGMVGASLRHAGEELLERGDGLAAYRERGALMGLPLLHPWANRLAGDEYSLHGRRAVLPAGPPLVRRDERGLAIHGLLTAHSGWTAQSGRDTERAWLRAALPVWAFPALHPAFPFAHELRLDIVLTPHRLRVATTVTATGATPVPIAFGYHPYLRLPGVDRAAWSVSLPPRRALQLDERGIPNGRGERRPASHLALGRRTFDDAFDGIAEGARFSIAGGGRTLAVSHDAGYPVAQVYSPEAAQFICLEPMTAPVNALRSGAGLRSVDPGGSFTAAFSIHVTESTA